MVTAGHIVVELDLGLSYCDTVALSVIFVSDVHELLVVNLDILVDVRLLLSEIWWDVWGCHCTRLAILNKCILITTSAKIFVPRVRMAG